MGDNEEGFPSVHLVLHRFITGFITGAWGVTRLDWNGGT